MVTVGVGLRWPAGWWGGVLDVDGVAFQRLGVHVVRSAQPLWWWSRPRTASRAQLMAAARVTRSVVMRARPRVRARCSTSSCGWMAMVRPRRDAVHADRRGQVAHQGRNDARPPPPEAGTMAVVCPAGQVTVAWSRSTAKRSLGNRPPLLRAGGHLAVTVNPAASRPARVAASP